MRHGENREYTHLNTTFFNDTLILTFVDLFFELSTTLVKVETTAVSNAGRSQQLFKRDLRICQTTPSSRRNPMTNALLETFRRVSNFTLKCPFPAGQYYLAINTLAFEHLFPINLAYKPSSYLRSHLCFYEEKPKKNLTYLADFMLQFVIVSDC